MSDNGLSRLQREGMATASDVFDRVLASIETAPATPATNGSLPKSSRVALTQVRSAAARTLDLYGELFQRAFDTYADLAQAAMQPGPDAAGPVTLAAPPGEEASAPLWLHNVTAARVEGVALALTDLTSAAGGRIEATAAAFSPARLDVDAGTSAQTLLRVAVPRTAERGVYWGHVLTTALPEGALPVRLAVGR